MPKKALIIGVAGQDGSYLSEHLLEKGYEVHGLVRRNSTPEHQESRIHHLGLQVQTHYGDLTDQHSLDSVIRRCQPDEIYNLGAQSHVRISFELPQFTAQVNGLGVLNLLTAVRLAAPDAKVYQASSSEMFGDSVDPDNFQRETTPMTPVSPYGCAKLFGYHIVRNYRKAYGMYAANGILFNHESPRRGETFVTKKITMGLAAISFGFQKHITLGNIHSKRDWGHAKDFVEAQWKILQQKKPDDFVISTDKQYSVKYFFELCCNILEIKISWSGKKFNEIAKVLSFNNQKTPSIKKNMIILKISKKYFRPNEVSNLIGNSNKAKKKFNWKSRYTIQQIAKEMIEADYNSEKNKFISLNL